MFTVILPLNLMTGLIIDVIEALILLIKQNNNNNKKSVY